MKTPTIFGIVFGLAFVCGASSASAQTLYTPSGTVGMSGNGNVGIGTSTPGAKLDVQGNAAFSNGGTFGWTANIGGNNGLILGTIGKATTPSGGQGAIQIFSNDATNQLQGIVSLVTDSTAGNRRLSIGAIEQGIAWRNVTIAEGGGNVGIGTTSPEAKLQVQGFFFVNSTSDATGGIYYGGPSNGLIIGKYSTSPWLGINGLYVGGNSQYDGTAIFSGNVGIGTSTLTYKLSVNGTIRAKEVIVDTGWSDYVFDKDYRLAPLSEVEARIKADKHLPGIPSAQEVAAHGVTVGDMQARLLAKIEELTLHQIEQEKRSLQQETRSLQQERRLDEQAARIVQLERENASLRHP